ncbi:hypothetical protein [Sciscionella sediminilitoris]|uniref:hypothetical protein n=1 Tax=Sciscionella sediminilitoris TaxID=1445613 RepID=UPI0004DF32C6|nr:hypothetical protein [Sciscionella sp. SE31]
MRHNTLPTHARTGLRALGYTKRGPIWPVLGGSEDTTPDGEQGKDASGKDSDAGKTFSQADVDRIVADRISRERGKFADYEALKQKAAEYEAHLEASASDQEKAVKAARKEGYAEAMSKALARIAAAEVRAVAADRLDVDALLEGADLSRFAKGEDIDRAAIVAWIDKLAPSKQDGSGDSGGWPDMAQGGRPPVSPDPGFGTDRVRAAYAQPNR